MAKFVLFFLLLFSLSLFAQSDTTHTPKKSFLGKFHPDSLVNKELKFLPFPSFEVSPETGVQLGAYMDYYYKLGKNDSTRPSLSWLEVFYTTRKQFMIDLYSSTFTNKEKYFIGFRGAFMDYYERYWGVSRYSLDHEDYIEVFYERLYASGKVTRNLGNQRFIGPTFYYSLYKELDYRYESPLQQLFLPAHTRSQVAGLGLNFNIDKRDNQFAPSKGHYLDISHNYYWNLQSSQFAYYSLSLDVRKYFEWKKHVLANQFVFQGQYGAVPEFETLKLGGNSLMRGFFEGRHRDKALWAVQTEYRYGLTKMIKIAAFSSIAQTGQTTADLLKSPLYVSGGVGLRVLLNKAKHIYLRVDFALTNTGTDGFYLKSMEAF